MSETTMVNFRMDTALKQNMENVCREMGMSMTTAFTIFAAKVSREKKIPFEVNADPFYSAENMAYLSRIAAEIDSGKAKLVEHKLVEVRCMRLLWHEKAWEDYLYWQTQDKKTLKRINSLLQDMQRNTFEGIGEPEPLRGNLSGWWSRRIDGVNRIVYLEQTDTCIYV